MKTKIGLHSISFFLFALLLFKVAALHVYTHEGSSTDAIENCSICDVAIENQNTDYVFTETVFNDTVSFDFFELKSPIRQIPTFTSFHLRYRPFSRPPPCTG
ncbi:hypothetical protein FGM00_06555 [Aggregatimonas sangjinii]|uniref:Uncharacterized protein n=1 Tax=Aggregatimonas sangjinii TaxID=2583587 RepID=A0A5B7SM88_9FLAO|nr:hypothetical protein [Aggregatimonas sangjinii]QCW99774.1 hypothetical protein FGM00_06555 [Aggregatimonas sangjinii]